ncbi:MAG: hypothetical protein JXB62_09335, partial [Pirellulales bacterium]|nr:hypothetical protein [Pirellulales bacterium]
GLPIGQSVPIRLRVSDTFGLEGDDLTTLTIYSHEPAMVVGRHVFYNNSAFDGNDPASNALDDEAIATDKLALLPGQTATFANYTSYFRGINGIMVDIANLAGTPTAADFEFRVGNGSGSTGWTPGATPHSVEVREGAGTEDSDRVAIIWDDFNVIRQWLQVTVLATPNTGLSTPHVFYFGNAVGEAGNSTADAKVNATDMLLARNNPRTFLDPAPVDFPYDYNRDARVNAADMLIARNNQTHFLNALQLITAPGGKEAADDAVLKTSDAVLKTSDAARPGDRAALFAETEWLYEFERASARRERSAEGDSKKEAVDELFSRNWP